MSERFCLVPYFDAEHPYDSDGDVLVDSADGRELGRDFGFPPEDALLTRAWAWVLRELNALAGQLAAVDAEVARVREGADRLTALLPALRDAARAAGQRVRRCKERGRVLRELEFVGKVWERLGAVTEERDALKAELDAAWGAVRVPVRGLVSLAEVVGVLRVNRERDRKVVEALPAPLAAEDWQVLVDALRAREVGLLSVRQVAEADRVAASHARLAATLTRLSVCEIVRHAVVEREATAVQLSSPGEDSAKFCRDRLEEVQRRIREYGYGDRPSSPPVALLREEAELLARRCETVVVSVDAYKAADAAYAKVFEVYGDAQRAKQVANAVLDALDSGVTPPAGGS